MKMTKIIILMTIFLVNSLAYAQKDDKPKKVDHSKEEKQSSELENKKEKPTVALHPAKEKKTKVIPEPKQKKSEYYDFKIRKVILVTQMGNRKTIEKFYVLKEYKAPNRFAPLKYLYDKSEEKLIEYNPLTTNVRKPLNELGMPLHGSYTKKVNGNVVENGFYYLGTKHNRWENFQYDASVKDMVLTDKRYFYRGFLRDAQITYYDMGQSKVKEVVPTNNGVLDGFYQFFYESGALAVQGEYKDNEKVGRWYEFYDAQIKAAKRITQYPFRPYTDEKPYILQEWDEKGKIITNSEK